MSWLNLRGKPQVALVHFTIPCESPNIVESKSFKLYLNSFTTPALAMPSEVQSRLRADISEAVGGAPHRHGGVKLIAPELFDQEPVHELDGLSLDRLDMECTRYQPAPELLKAQFGEAPVTEVLTSNLLKSNCLVTGQPDWGSVQIRYTGPRSTRKAAAVHREFSQPQRIPRAVCGTHLRGICGRLQPIKLMVYARHAPRRLDINPWRTSHPRHCRSTCARRGSNCPQALA